VVIAGFQIIVIAGAHASCAALLFPDVKVHDSASFGSHLGNVAQIQECAKPHVADPKPRYALLKQM
jgi:hypothetical protein